MSDIENWDDIPENENEKEIDYWEVLDKSDKVFILTTLKTLISKDSKVTKLKEWTQKHQKGLMKSYIKGLKELRIDAFCVSMQDFGMFAYVALNVKKEDLEVEEERKPVEQKPQSLKLQKELDDMYTEDNINDAIKELGIFTKDDREENENN